MSTLLQTDWLSDFAPSNPVAAMVIVISGQFELTDLPFKGWWECACIDCEKVEVFEGSLTAFAEKLRRRGWCVDSLERTTAICGACVNKPGDEYWAAQYQDGSGGLL